MRSRAVERGDVESSRRSSRGDRIPTLVFGTLCVASAMCLLFGLATVVLVANTSESAARTLALPFILTAVGTVGTVVSGGLYLASRS